MTTYTRTQVGNMAIGHIGSGDLLSDIATDDSDAADALNVFLTITLEQTLRDFPWPFATKTVDSTDTTTAATNVFAAVASSPNDEWGWSYRYPTDCLEVRRIQSGTRNDGPVSRVPYRIGYDGTTSTATGRLIFTDMEDAILEYTAYVTDMSIYPPDFVLAWSYRLAAMAAPRICMTYTAQIGNDLMQKYYLQIQRAKANSGNEEQPDRMADAEWIGGR